MYFCPRIGQHAPVPFRPSHPRSIDPLSKIDSDHSRSGIAAAATTMILWSAGNVMVRSIEMPGLQIAFWRILLSATLYWMLSKLRGRTLSLDQLRTATPTAVAISLEIAVFFVAIKRTTVANATIIGSLFFF